LTKNFVQFFLLFKEGKKNCLKIFFQIDFFLRSEKFFSPISEKFFSILSFFQGKGESEAAKIREEDCDIENSGLRAGTSLLRDIWTYLQGPVCNFPHRERKVIRYIKIDSSWLETNQEKQLFGGEKLAFCLENKEKNTPFDYVLCLVNFQAKNQLRRNREDESSTEPPNQRLPEKLLKSDNSIQEVEITCSICLEILNRCATLSPCGHNFCGNCLVKHLRNSLFGPLCKTKIVSVIKHLAFQNIIEAAVRDSSSLQRPSNEEMATIQKDLDGNVYADGKNTFIVSMLNGKKEGPGAQISTDGQIFQGFWKNDKKEGEGVLILKDGSIIKGV